MVGQRPELFRLAHCGRRPQHFVYFFPLPHGQGSFRPTFDPVEGAGMGDGVDFEDACAVLESCNTEDWFHRPQYEMLSAVSVIGRKLSPCCRRGRRSVAFGFPFEFFEGSHEWVNDSLPEERTDFIH
jgi:hypothetical protein